MRKIITVAVILIVFLSGLPKAFEPMTPVAVVLFVYALFAAFCGAITVMVFRAYDWLKSWSRHKEKRDDAP